MIVMRSLVGGPACPAATYVYERTYSAIVPSNGPIQRSSPGSRVQVLHLPASEQSMCIYGMQKLFVVFVRYLHKSNSSLLNVHEPYNSTCENSSKFVSKINLAASLKTENV